MTKQQIIDLMNSQSRYNMHNGIYIKDFGKDFCLVEGELRPEALNPWGMAHGGFVYSLCDVATGVLVGISGRGCVTLSGSLNYLHPSRGNRLFAESRIIKDGSHVVVAEATVTDENGTVTAKGCFELYITEGKP